MSKTYWARRGLRVYRKADDVAGTVIKLGDRAATAEVEWDSGERNCVALKDVWTKGDTRERAGETP